MENQSPNRAELNKISKDSVITLYLQLHSSFNLILDQNKTILAQNERQLEQTELLSKQNEQLSRQNEQLAKQSEQQLQLIESLREQVAILTNYRFGRKTEKTADMYNGQMVLSFDEDGNCQFLNEAEYILDQYPEEEKTDEELLQEAKERMEKRKRKEGVRAEDLKNAKVEPVEYTIPVEKLNELFPEGYTELPARITHRVEYIPAELHVYEEHIHVYKSKKTSRFVEADHPKHLLNHSYLTPSLFSKIATDKFVKALPVQRISKEIGWMDVVMRPQTISRWIINITKQYLTPIMELMKDKIKNAELIHCDETPFLCVEDNKKEGRTKNSKSYMWVFHTANQYGSPPIFIYDYKDNRRTENVENFLSGYKGIIMADGYEPYHTVAKKSNGDLVVGGCWAHCKRRFAEIVKADSKNAIGTTAFEGNERIAKIYRIDNKSKGMAPDDRLAYRQEKVKPLVNDFFEWAKKRVDAVASANTRKALQYAINQEPYLRAFLDNGIIPLDNSDAERSIRSFCVGKHNWHLASASKGAEASGILYSIEETAKANGLKPYEYIKYLLEQLLEEVAPEDLVPWSDKLPEKVRVTR